DSVVTNTANCYSRYIILFCYIFHENPRKPRKKWCVSPVDSLSSGNTITNRLGEFREIRESNERTGIAAHGHPAGTPGAPGVERLRPNEDGLWSDGGERGKTDGFFRRDR